MTDSDRPLAADPHMAWSAYCLIDDHPLCEQPDMCGCHCHHHRVDDDHDQRDQEQP